MPEACFGIPIFLRIFDETFHKSGYLNFAQFMKNNSNCSKWMIFSDYVIGDPNKSNDVFTFSLLPATISIGWLMDKVHELSPKDVKNTRSINAEFLELIKKLPMFHISIIFNKSRKLDFDDEQKFFAEKTDSAIGMLKHWIKTTPANKKRYQDEIKSLNVLKNEITRKNPNLKLIRDIDILACLIAYIKLEMVKLTPIDTIGWFSDRDKMLDFNSGKIKTPLIHDLIDSYFYLFRQSENIQHRIEVCFGRPEESGKMWYDDLNRFPDYISGTIADMNFEDGKVTNGKFTAIIEGLIASNDKVDVISMNLLKESITANRIAINLLTIEQ